MLQSTAAGQLGEGQPHQNMAQAALNWHGEFHGGPLSGTDFYGDKEANKQTNRESVHYSKMPPNQCLREFRSQHSGASYSKSCRYPLGIV